jgi:carboxyl-terminal processing protease
MAPLGRRSFLAGGGGVLILAAYGIDRALRAPEGSSGGDVRFAALGGIWRSRGYGWVWQIADGNIRAFDESGSYCIARPDLGRRLRDLDRGFELSADGRVLRLSLEDPAYRYTFDRIDSLPEACGRVPDASPVGVLDALGAIFSAHYAFFAVRGVDWPALVAAARGKLASDASEKELLAVLGGLLSHIDDDHVTLEAKIRGKRFDCDPGQAKMLRPDGAATFEPRGEAEARVGRLQQSVWAGQDAGGLLGDTARTVGNGNIRYGLIGGDVGYLGLLAMDNFDKGDDDERVLEAALDDALELFQGVRAVIVDVSLNDGGEDRFARKVAARFAAVPTPAYSKYAGDALEDTPQAISLVPGSGPRYLGPVYVLTSNITLSAAEIFVLAMRALPNVTQTGQTTRGSLSDVLAKRLPNGWGLTVSNEVYLDHGGTCWEGRGIAPQLPLSVLAPGADPAVTHARALRTLAARVG